MATFPLYHRPPKTAGSLNGNARRCATRSSKPRRSSAVGNATRSWRRRLLKGPLPWMRKWRRRKSVRRQEEEAAAAEKLRVAATRRRRAVASRVSFASHYMCISSSLHFVRRARSEKKIETRTAKPTPTRKYFGAEIPRLRSCTLATVTATMLAARAAAAGCSRRLRPSPARLSSWIIRSCPYTGGPRATLARPAAEFERHPAFRQLDRDLDEAGVPCFPARGEDVRVLNDPSEFYQTLLVRLLAL